MTFLDIYSIFHRAFTAIIRDQPWEDKFWGAAKELGSPFVGLDIAFGAVLDTVKNSKRTGGQVYDPFDPSTFNKAVDISAHVMRSLEPGISGQIRKTYKAALDEHKPGGLGKYSLKDEGLAWAGVRLRHAEPLTAITFRAIDFTKSRNSASARVTRAISDPSAKGTKGISTAVLASQKQLNKAYEEMAGVAAAAVKTGASTREVYLKLRGAGISERAARAIVRGETLPLTLADRTLKSVMERVGKDPELRRQGIMRYREALRVSRQLQ